MFVCVFWVHARHPRIEFSSTLMGEAKFSFSPHTFFILHEINKLSCRLKCRSSFFLSQPRRTKLFLCFSLSTRSARNFSLLFCSHKIPLFSSITVARKIYSWAAPRRPGELYYPFGVPEKCFSLSCAFCLFLKLQKKILFLSFNTSRWAEFCAKKLAICHRSNLAHDWDPEIWWNAVICSSRRSRSLGFMNERRHSPSQKKSPDTSGAHALEAILPVVADALSRFPDSACCYVLRKKTLLALCAGSAGRRGERKGFLRCS